MIFGLGTGRCGTQSLSYLLNQQKEHKVGHEFLAHNLEHGPLPWEYDEDLIIKRLDTLKEHGFTGDVALYFPPNEPEALARLMTQLTEQGTTRTELEEKGKLRSAEFSWAKTAKITWDVLHNLGQLDSTKKA